MQYTLSPQDYQLMLDQNDGDVEATNAFLVERGYSVPGGENTSLAITPPRAGGPLEPWQEEHIRNMQGELGDEDTSFAVNAPADLEEDADAGEDTPSDLSVGANSLSGILAGQRKSIGDLYDKITQNIQQRYRKPDINDLLVNVGMGMMSAPGENDSGGFGGAVQRGLRGIGTYAQSRRAYETDMNKMLSELETAKVKDLAGLEEKYLTSAASALKPRIAKPVGTQIIGGKIVAIAQDPDTGEYTQTVLGEAPADLSQTNQTVNGQPVFNSPKGLVLADGTPVTQFDVKPKPLTATEQREMFDLEDNITSGLGSVKTLEEALSLNQQAYEGSLTNWRKTLGQLFGSDDPRYVATENFDNIIMTNALSSMKAIFGGNPTEGERAALRELQAISSKSRPVREAILRRALAAVKSRIARGTSRLQSIKGGEYSTRGGSTAGQSSRPRVINWGQ
jgi:hypothetical protein